MRIEGRPWADVDRSVLPLGPLACGGRGLTHCGRRQPVDRTTAYAARRTFACGRMAADELPPAWTLNRGMSQPRKVQRSGLRDASAVAPRLVANRYLYAA